ncbi:hypothetical protein GTW52_03275 [Streptomyces sp. SID8358]|nr:hypothetical protein [Streptomyces sp. SID8358]
MRHLGGLRPYAMALLPPLLLLAACSGGAPDTGEGSPAPGRNGPSPSATGSPAGALDADPARLPRDRGAARALVAQVIADPAGFGPGIVRRTPYESDPETSPVLGADCVWHAGKLRASVLATLSRSYELPAEGGKGPVRLSAAVTVHRTADDARWDTAESLEETMRCPSQQLRQGERIESMVSTGLLGGEDGPADYDDLLIELGTFRSDELGGPHAYVWQQAQILQFTVAVTGKGAEGRPEKEISALLDQAQAGMLARLDAAVKKQS